MRTQLFSFIQILFRIYNFTEPQYLFKAKNNFKCTSLLSTWAFYVL